MKYDKMESPFPNSTEEIVASALLLLSSSPCDGTTDTCHIDRSKNLSLCKSCSRSSASSSVSSDDASSDEVHGRCLHMVARAIALSEHEMKFKVVRKSRSKTLWISDCRKNSSVEQKNFVVSGSSSETTEGSSCFSGGSSSLVTSSESWKSKTKRERPLAPLSSSHLIRRSEAILEMLANGSASEVRIRQLLGDSPDTSKALRMLLKKEEVRRSGAGGRTDPFIYQITAG